MKKYCPRILSVLLAVCLTISITVPAFAAGVVDDADFPLSTNSTSVVGPTIYPVSFGEDEVALLDQFNSMTADELSEYIIELGASEQSRNSSDQYPVGLAPSFKGWLAATVYLAKIGFPCAGTLLQYSLAGEDYTETNGLLSEKIKPTTKFQNWLHNDATNEYKSIVYEKEDSWDLLLALHDIRLRRVHSTTQGSVINGSDTFDFNEHADFNGFVAVLNQFGWLMTELGYFHEIEVYLVFLA